MKNRVTFWAVLLLVVALVFSGCTPRVGAGSVVERDPNTLFVDLPALVVDYDSDGTASVGGLTHMDIGNTEAPGGVVLPAGIRLGLATALYGMSLDPNLGPILHSRQHPTPAGEQRPGGYLSHG